LNAYCKIYVENGCLIEQITMIFGSQLQFFAKDVTRQEASKDLELLVIS
jgi:hypothetical protein